MLTACGKCKHYDSTWLMCKHGRKVFDRITGKYVRLLAFIERKNDGHCKDFEPKRSIWRIIAGGW